MQYPSDAHWSTTRPAVLYVAKMNGSLDVWDFLFRCRMPTLNVMVRIYMDALNRIWDSNTTSVRENVCNNSKKLKVMLFWFFIGKKRKNVKKRTPVARFLCTYGEISMKLSTNQIFNMWLQGQRSNAKVIARSRTFFAWREISILSRGYSVILATVSQSVALWTSDIKTPRLISSRLMAMQS